MLSKKRTGRFTGYDIHRLWGRQSTIARYILDKVDEMLNGQKEGYVSTDMQWGKDTEAEAIFMYELETGRILESPGFKEYTQWGGGTADGIAEDRGAEFKCPQRHIHEDYKLMKSGADLKKHKRQYWYQCQKYMAIHDKSVWDFVSYCDGELFILPIESDPGFKEDLTERLEKYGTLKDQVFQIAKTAQEGIMQLIGDKASRNFFDLPEVFDEDEDSWPDESDYLLQQAQESFKYSDAL